MRTSLVNYLRGSFLTMSLLVSVSFSFGQKLEDDLAKIVAKLDSASSFSMVVDVKLYTSKGGELMYSSNASLEQKGKASVTILGEAEIFNNESVRIDVDHDGKHVSIVSKKKISDKAKKEMQIDVADILKWLKNEEESKAPTIKLVNAAAAQRTYSITGLDEFAEVRFILDMTNYSIKSIQYTYQKEGEQEGKYVELNYTKFKLNAVERSLSPDSYYTMNGGKCVLTQRFKGYHLSSGL